MSKVQKEVLEGEVLTSKKSSTAGKFIGGATALALATASQAAVTAPDFTGPIADVGILLGAMLGFGAIVWGGRKLLGFIG